MIQSLIDYRLKRCSMLSRRLVEFKNALQSPDFEVATNNLHVGFLQLLSSFEMKPLPGLERKELQSNGEIRRFKVHEIELLVYEGLVIDVSDAHKELAGIFVNKRLEEAEKAANLLWDYKDRPCDGCGMYFVTPGFLTPTVRIEMEGYTIALHELCSDLLFS